MKKVSIVIIIIVLAILGYYYYQNRTITLTININGNNLTNDTKVSCNTKYKDHNCSLMLPTLNQRENQFLSYNIVPNTKQVLYDQKQIINIKDNLNLYVIEEETIELKLNIELNGSTTINNEAKCITTKRLNKCLVTLPNAVRTNGEVLGYDTLNNTKEPKYKIGDQLEITNNDSTLYVISKRKIKLTITNIDYIIPETSPTSCDVYNNDKSCSLELPKYYKIGYNNQNTYDLNGILYHVGDKIEINKDTFIKATPSVEDSASLKATNIEFEPLEKINTIYENTCEEKEEYKLFVNNINNRAPYMLENTKRIEFLQSSNFTNMLKTKYPTIKGPSSIVGLTLGNNIYIKCYSNNREFRYQTMVHELVHSELNGIVKIIKRSEVQILKDIGLYNTYTTYKNNRTNRPIRDYAYESEEEFLAEGFSYYYMQYIDPTIPYTTTKAIPDYIKIGFQKLDCVFKDYNNKYSNYNNCIA